jgi:drug/metabolite transporter (DMT)-like permease
MAWSWITQTRRYYANDYLSAATVTLGCVLFVLTGDITAPTKSSGTSDSSSSAPALSFTAVGLALLAVFMIFDGLTCTSQDKLFSSFDMHSCNQLLYTAAWSAALSAGFLVLSGQIHGAIHFILRHPDSLWLMLLQSAVSTAVQLFIVFTIKQYGALNFALMMTLRQFLSIVLSCLVFQHELSTWQWLGTVFVIGGLVIRSLDKAATDARKHGGRGGGGVLDSNSDTPGTPRGNITSSNTSGKSTGVLKGRNLDAERQPLLKNGSGNLAHGISNGVVSSNINGRDSAIDVMMTPSTRLKSINGGITSPRALIPIIAGPAPGTANANTSHIQNNNNNPLVNVLQPFGNVLASPLRGPFRSTLAPAFPGSGDLKEKPG